MRARILLIATFLITAGCQRTPAPTRYVPRNESFDLDLDVAGNLDRAYEEIEEVMRRLPGVNSDLVEMSRTFDNYPTFAASFSAVNRAMLYEGVPSDTEQRDDKRKIVELGHYQFYESPKDVAGEQLASLQQLLSHTSTVYPFRGLKDCDDGFHPDWRLEWQDGPHKWHADFCFGCMELEIVRDDTRILYCDLRDASSLLAAFDQSN